MDNTGNKGLLSIFGKKDFDADRFVKNIVTNNGIEEMLSKLPHMSMSVQKEVEHTVFSNYQFFSKIGKLTTQVQAIMPQIHSDFTEKGRIMNNLVEMSLFGTEHGVYQSVHDTTFNREENQSKKVESTITAPNKQPSKANLSQYAGLLVSELAGIVDGVTSISGNPDRRVIFDGDLRELNTENLSLLQDVHVFLFTDCLIVTFNNSSYSTPHRYCLQTTYDLFNVAVKKLSSHDHRHTAVNAFKLNVAPAPRLFQANSRTDRSAWIQRVKEAKKIYHGSARSIKVLDQRKNARLSWDTDEDTVSLQGSGGADEEGVEVSVAGGDQLSSAYALPPSQVSAGALQTAMRAITSTLPECADLLAEVNRLEGTLPSGAYEEFHRAGHWANASESQAGDESSSTSWLWQVPDDLNVAIAERNFAHATNLVVRALREIEIILASPGLTSIKPSFGTDKGVKPERVLINSKSREAWEDLLRRVRVNEAYLVEALQYELITTTDRRGATRVVKANVIQLGQLGKVNLAAQLFLVYRSNLLARSLNSGMRQEASQLVFFSRLSMIFHRQLVEARVDWQYTVVNALITLNVDGPNSMASGRQQLLNLMFHSWLTEEAGKFGRRLCVLFLDSRFMSFHIVTETLIRIRAHADKITELLGVDIFPAMFGSLLRVLRHTGEEEVLFLCDEIENRYKTETWEPVTEREADCHYAQDLYAKGLLDTRISIKGHPKSLPLTVGAYQSIRSLHQFIQSIKRLDCAEAVYFIKYFCRIIQTERRSYQAALAALSNGSSNKEADQLLIMKKNYEFFNQLILPALVKQLGELSSVELNAIFLIQ